MPRVLVIVNKDFEFQPLLSLLASRKVRPKTVPAPTSIELVDPPRSATPKPRVTLTANGLTVELWCVSDILDDPRSSSTLAKQSRLPLVIAGEAPALVIAVGTASNPREESLNGCVAMGTQAFAVDPWTHRPGATPPPDRATDARVEQLVTSALPPAWFRDISDDIRFAAEGRFLMSPIDPDPTPRIVAVHGQVALNTWNVTNYNDYAWADGIVLGRFTAAGTGFPIGSVETTHALIRLATPDAVPFLWVSGLSNRMGAFDLEVAPRSYSQDFVAAHNAGVTVLHLVGEVLRRGAV